MDVAQGGTIIFNAGTYTTIGANSVFRGTIFAGTCITTGENASISGVGSDCGGLFATNGAITLGALSQFGASGCWQAGQQNEEDDDEEYYDEEHDMDDGDIEDGDF